jgi:hypothetical protein
MELLTKNILKSRQLRRVARVPKRCYHNAYLVAAHLQCKGQSAVYVEGFAVSRMSFEHGWVELDGEIIDVALPDDDLAYFAGLRFADLGAALRLPRNGNWCALPQYHRFGIDGKESAEFTGARLRAALSEGISGPYIERLRAIVERLGARSAEVRNYQGDADE